MPHERRVLFRDAHVEQVSRAVLAISVSDVVETGANHRPVTLKVEQPVRNLIEAGGATLLLLPLRSPGFNPIETMPMPAAQIQPAATSIARQELRRDSRGRDRRAPSAALPRQTYIAPYLAFQ